MNAAMPRPSSGMDSLDLWDLREAELAFDFAFFLAFARLSRASAASASAVRMATSSDEVDAEDSTCSIVSSGDGLFPLEANGVSGTDTSTAAAVV